MHQGIEGIIERLCNAKYVDMSYKNLCLNVKKCGFLRFGRSIKERRDDILLDWVPIKIYETAVYLSVPFEAGSLISASVMPKR
jgi:hypothetical protein